MKFLLCLIMFFSGFTIADNTQYVSVVATSCYVYEDASFDKPVMKDNEKLILKHNQKLEVLEDNAEIEFIKIKLDEIEEECYIYRYYVTYNMPEQEIYPVFNGHVLHENTIIYTLDKEESGFVAKINQGIYLYNGYNDKLEYNPVQIVLDDGSLYFGLLKTADISPYGVNSGLITGIVVIASCLTIIFLLIFMKKKKQK